ncbi:hypothetical protein BDQ12DRAFT_683136 [Crucibulum laeve]|uniref:RNase H type-1 domain-containing protein n=1 Tax=Crucibulum laeve TaxID=68775 RepID=A0A5C3LZK7_9AGAR|nr:hypothetical protein BDQ12DRAFT_683136 [Crucibulum laeve]
MSRYPNMDSRHISLSIGPPTPRGIGSRRFITEENDPLRVKFKPMLNNVCCTKSARQVHIGKEKNASVLIFVDGSAPQNGHNDVRAGCGVVFRSDGKPLYFPLERVSDQPLSSNRAELCAAHAALCARAWAVEGFHRIVIGADSTYMVKGVND